MITKDSKKSNKYFTRQKIQRFKFSEINMIKKSPHNLDKKQKKLLA